MVNQITAALVAKYFIFKAHQEDKAITSKKLQKLVYYAQAWHFVFLNVLLFNDPIEAWVHGPAIRKLYGIYKKHGFDSITEAVSESEIKQIPQVQMEILDQIWATYGNYDAEYLEILTHSETPWIKAREGLEQSQNSSNVILPDEMKNYYRKFLETNESV